MMATRQHRLSEAEILLMLEAAYSLGYREGHRLGLRAGLALGEEARQINREARSLRQSERLVQNLETFLPRGAR